MVGGPVEPDEQEWSTGVDVWPEPWQKHGLGDLVPTGPVPDGFIDEMAPRKPLERVELDEKNAYKRT